ncbi:NAD(P)-binding protein [Annulohypoxylon bovei var. microspora]|nr:NAD(P)-binding protein [Annulohypoxylon bovei var. microspora]
MAATILITGASGLIGFRVLLAALAAGHNVRYTVRSEEKAQVVSSNPAVRKLAPGDRLSPVIISDFSADGAFDTALRGVTHIVHAGSPPTVKITSGLLSSALKAPTVQRVIITSSIVANLGFTPPPPQLLPVPSTFGDVFEGYITGKIVELHNTDEFVKTGNPHFTVSHVIPGYVFGRNELALDAAMMQTQNSSNNFLMMGMVGGGDAPKAGEIEDFGVATKVDYGSIFDLVEKTFPKAVEAGVFKRGKVPTLPVNYESSDVEKLLGRKLKTFDSAVVDVASQYLEKLGKDKA